MTESEERAERPLRTSSEREGSQRERARPPPLPDPLPAEVLDSHCHLDAMGVDIGRSLASARAVGVTRVVTVGDTLESSRWCAETAAAFPEVVAAVDQMTAPTALRWSDACQHQDARRPVHGCSFGVRPQLTVGEAGEAGFVDLSMGPRYDVVAGAGGEAELAARLARTAH